MNEDDLEWDWGGSLAFERLKLVELLFARGRYPDARDAASLFDHQGPIAYMVLLPASLSFRWRAAIAMGNHEAARDYRQRLIDLGRPELVETPR
jgi:hypothetical protein